ncbi:MAG: dihydroorotase [Phreatobacter sp.]|uniref:dihydroorotase n=1 Tax=Phreatobacter sp. TaxID=1966341 RepID=UPI001A4E924C|nr:dihydroorotase [Phreatobacter sp.]MBL8571877.1 dihydroorotase [Phreatobacter sp.]
MTDRLTIRRPDDWHVHLRDGAMLAAVAPLTATRFARAIVMPNLVPPVTTTAEAIAYRERIRAAVPASARFTPLMTAYLTDHTDPADLAAGAAQGVFTAVKLYPAHATTNSAHGVTDVAKLDKVFAAMERAGLPLLVHGEVTRPSVDVFDRETLFIDEVLDGLVQRHPGLRLVLEHITTRRAADYVLAAPERVAATITPHHLVINRTDIFRGGLRPHLYCLPIAKREEDRIALRRVATSGNAKFFLGTDSAPHGVEAKECACGAAGIFNVGAAIEVYAQVFDEEGALDRLEAFASLNGPRFYRLPPNEERIVLVRAQQPAPEAVGAGPTRVRAFPETALAWRIEPAA